MHSCYLDADTEYSTFYIYYQTITQLLCAFLIFLSTIFFPVFFFSLSPHTSSFTLPLLRPLYLMCRPVPLHSFDKQSLQTTVSLTICAHGAHIFRFVEQIESISFGLCRLCLTCIRVTLWWKPCNTCIFIVKISEKDARRRFKWLIGTGKREQRRKKKSI